MKTLWIWGKRVAERCCIDYIWNKFSELAMEEERLDKPKRSYDVSGKSERRRSTANLLKWTHQMTTKRRTSILWYRSFNERALYATKWDLSQLNILICRTKEKWETLGKEQAVDIIFSIWMSSKVPILSKYPHLWKCSQSVTCPTPLLLQPTEALATISLCRNASFLRRRDYGSKRPVSAVAGRKTRGALLNNYSRGNN